ncbi:MAG: hypothetical protein IPH96_12120 [Saprospiraceae bacterium]|nr:hypothetical protein [Saprospiraceae bacterium]
MMLIQIQIQILIMTWDPINDEIKDPKDEDDYDPELLPVHDLAIRKIVVDPTRIYLPDEIVDFKVTVFNQGNQDAIDNKDDDEDDLTGLLPSSKSMI